MKNILFAIIILSLFFNSCKHPVSVPNYDNYEDKGNYDIIEMPYSIESFPKLDKIITHDIIYTQFMNASFENSSSGQSNTPNNWKNCGNSYESPPDIHNLSSQFFEVTQEPHHGNNYLGLIARDNYTKEKISQKLAVQLIKNEDYSFSIYISRSKDYISGSKSSMKKENFNEPVRLLIWASKLSCDKRILITETKAIEHTDWQEYNFTIQPTFNVKYLMFEVSYLNNLEDPYNGNILIDNISPIYKITK